MRVNSFSILLNPPHAANTADSILICVKQKLYAGELRIVKMNLKGESLNEYDEPIPRKLWEGNWKNERLLVPSNELLKSQNQN